MLFSATAVLRVNPRLHPTLADVQSTVVLPSLAALCLVFSDVNPENPQHYGKANAAESCQGLVQPWWTHGYLKGYQHHSLYPSRVMSQYFNQLANQFAQTLPPALELVGLSSSGVDIARIASWHEIKCFWNGRSSLHKAARRVYTYRIVWESVCVLWNLFVLSKGAAVRSTDCSLEWHPPPPPPCKGAECKHAADSAKAKKGSVAFIFSLRFAVKSLQKIKNPLCSFYSNLRQSWQKFCSFMDNCRQQVS